jgi:TetR/AcrR family transcriptional regulator, regulator of autoinduction and epiphytic fitness
VSRPELSYRQLQAQATRDRVALAARRLFGERGYLATTIEAIAREAGVAVPTVYAIFGSKKAILEEIRRRWIRESEVLELGAQALAEPDLGRRLELAAKWTRQQLERGYDVIAIYQDAARADPAMAKVWEKVLRNRDQALTGFIKTLAAGLAPGVDTKTAVDLFWALGRPEVYRELVVDRGWSLARYERWLATSLKQQLLGAGL